MNNSKTMEGRPGEDIAAAALTVTATPATVTAPVTLTRVVNMVQEVGGGTQLKSKKGIVKI